MERRRQKDIDRAKMRRKEANNLRFNNRNERIAKLASLVRPTPREGKENVRRDPNRAIGQTISSLNHAFTAVELDDKEKEVGKLQAHNRPIALGARDLICESGLRRAVPTWRKAL
eukprot:14512621-Ditylum_brightwellii.AAC.1